MAKYTFVYDPNSGAALTDGQVHGYADMLIAAAIATGGIDVVVGNELIIQYIRLAILEEKLDYREVQFKSGDKVINVDINGNLEEWPGIITDIEFDLASEILMLQIKKSKARKELKNGNPSN